MYSDYKTFFDVGYVISYCSSMTFEQEKVDYQFKTCKIDQI